MVAQRRQAESLTAHRRVADDLRYMLQIWAFGGGWAGNTVLTEGLGPTLDMFVLMLMLMLMGAQSWWLTPETLPTC